MNTLPAIKEDNALEIALKDVEMMKKMTSELMKSKHYQKMGEDGIFAIVQSAKTLGINPLEALNGALYYVGGKVGMGAETMNALIRRKGHSIVKDQKSDNTVCILHGKRADSGDTWTVQFSLDDAKRAGLLRNLYDKYPGVMLYNRAMSMLARQLFPDVIHNAGYNIDELNEIAKSNTNFLQIKEEAYQEIDNYINDEQIQEINLLVSHLDEDTKLGFYEYIKVKFKAKEIKEIMMNDYEKIVKILKTRVETAKKVKEREESELQDEVTENVG